MRGLTRQYPTHIGGYLSRIVDTFLWVSLICNVVEFNMMSIGNFYKLLPMS